MKDAQFQFVEGQSRDSFPALLAELSALGELAVRDWPCQLERSYGEHPRKRYDYFSASGTARGTLVYFHAGYWQSRDKSAFRALAPAFAREGLNVALVNYPLCPNVSLDELIDSTREAVIALIREPEYDAAPAMIAAGHSAGGHIACELALTDWVAKGLPTSPIKGVLALSGIYDLRPLVTTTLNAKLGLDEASALHHSPLYRCTAGLPPALFAVGAEETPAFLAQAETMADRWQQTVNEARSYRAPRADHFGLLKQILDEESDLSAHIRSFISLVC